MRFIVKCALLLIPALALAAPAFAQRLSDSQEPGSVIVFPKFINNGTVTVDGVPGNHRTEIEIGAVCPHHFTTAAATPAGFVQEFCPEHELIKVRFHWVCPGIQDVNTKFICRETSFDVFLTVNGKLAFTADGLPINANSPRVPTPPCKSGYLIGWVISPLNDLPVKFDGLIGDAVIRGPNVGAVGGAPGASTAVSAYRAITIQAADPTQPNYTGGTTAIGDSAITLDADVPGTGNPALVFDGLNRHYAAVTGTLYGDVIFDKTTPLAAPLVGPLSETFLTLLTLDVRSNRPNNPTNVDILFFNESLATVSATNPLFEYTIDTHWEFLCWAQVQLSTIDPNLTQAFFQTRKGGFIAGPATKDPTFGFNDPTLDPLGRVTLLGLIHTTEGLADPAHNFMDRHYFYEPYNNSFPTRYVPFTL